MSKEICEELNFILNNSKPNSFMGLSGNDLETIRQKSQNLSFDERANLLINFSSAAGTILYDAGGLFEAQIQIDDKQSSESVNRPLAYIKFTDGYNARVEVIDILESVRNDATLIGHPVILFAIHHWQEVIAWEKYNKQDDVYSEEKNIKSLNHRLVDKFIESARDNLERIGKALLEGARKKAIPKESAIDLKIRSLDIDAKNTYLYVAWKRLGKRHINETYELEQRIQQVMNFLAKLPSINDDPKELDKLLPKIKEHIIIDTNITLLNVFDFLKADGSKFIFNESIITTLRPRWKVFRNSFIKWYFNKKASTVDKYQRTAKEQQIEAEPYTLGLFSSTPKANLYHFFHNVFSSPLKNVCPPIECSEDIVGSDRFTKLITQTSTK